MIDFNLQLPKKGESRISALKQVAVMFSAMVSSGSSFDGESTEKSVHAFMKKQLRREEYPLFLALVYADDETIPSEFSEYEIVTLEEIVDYASSGRVLELNDLLALETDDTISALARACGIRAKANMLSQRLDLIKTLYEKLYKFETMFVVSEGLKSHFAKRYSFDFHTESTRWRQVSSKLDAAKIAKDNSNIGNSSVTRAVRHWEVDALRVFCTSILNEDVGSARAALLLSTLVELGPQEILRRIRNHGLISELTFQTFEKFDELDFAQTIARIVEGWRTAFHGNTQVIFDPSELDSDGHVLLDDFLRAYNVDDEDEEEDEEEEDDEEDDSDPDEEDDSDPDEEEEEEEEEDDAPAHGTPKHASQEQLIELLEDELDSESQHDAEYYLDAPIDLIRKAISTVYSDNKQVLEQLSSARHYEVYRLYASLADIDFDDAFELSEILADKFWAWESDLDQKEIDAVSRLLFARLIPTLDASEYTPQEMREEINAFFEATDGVAEFYKTVDAINEAAKARSLSAFSVSPINGSNAEKPAITAEHNNLINKVIELKIVDRSRATTMSVSELRASLAEHEALKKVSDRKVTKENYLEVIPTLSRQELIGELAKRGYSDNSLRKLGAPRLREMFIGALNRMYA